MGRIVVLDENTSNKIAAGEVIERPASVVKELVENSIDAGAGSVTVEVKNGGITYIRVTDNGSGIDEDDAEIAFERHATSKIRNANDLDAITTLGFRGEALSSIAAVSSVELTTRTRKNEYGIYINIKGGAVKEVKQVGSPVGTTFVVSDLFYNTPARYKFLKKDTTEFGHISEILNRMALANPQVSIKLIGNNSTVLHTPGNNDLLSVIFSIYGKDISKNVLPINYNDGRLNISGYAGRPDISRATRDYQSIFINGRYIKSKIISAAVDEAYKTLLMKNRHPFMVIDIRLNPMLVDVNVHPTKMEVRFSEEQEIFRSIYHAVNNALLGTSLVRDIRLEEKTDNIFKIKGREYPKAGYAQQNIRFEEHSVKEVSKRGYDSESLKDCKSANPIDELSGKPGLSGGEITKDARTSGLIKTGEEHYKDNSPKSREESGEAFIKELQNESGLKLERELETEPEREPAKGRDEVIKKEPGRGTVVNPERAQEEPDKWYQKDSDNGYQKESYIAHEKAHEKAPEKTLEKALGTEPHKELENKLANELGTQAGEALAENCFREANIIGQVFSTYILLQKDKELILIDQHAAHERIMFEHFREKYKNRESIAQILMTPVVVDLTYQEIKFLDEKKEYLNNLGFIYESFGNNSIILREVPYLDDTVSVKELFLEVLDRFIKTAGAGVELIAEETIYTIACKAAIKANRKLDNKEIKEILDKLAAMGNPYTCPHGRPVIVKLSKYELEKMFKRIV